jgi:hypothetical protein
MFAGEKNESLELEIHESPHNRSSKVKTKGFRNRRNYGVVKWLRNPSHAKAKIKASSGFRLKLQTLRQEQNRRVLIIL